MRVRGLDGNGDWTFGKGRNDYKTGLNAIQQMIQTRLMSFLGDCPWALTEGIDWFNLLGSKSVAPLELAIRTTILNTQYVSGLLQLSLNVIDRRMTVSYSVATTYGNLNGTFVFDQNGAV